MAKAEQLNEFVTLYQGDCLDVLPTLDAGAINAVITDPPYGMNWDSDATRFTGGKGGHVKGARPIHGDDKPFDPSPWLTFPRVVLFGSNHFGASLPVGTTLVWVKKSDAKLGTFLSGAEVAWMKGGHGVYVKRIIWDGVAREGRENRQHFHPTQKPVALMRWCIEKARVPENGLILDPYAGSGTMALAAMRSKCRCVLIEKDAGYCDVIRERVKVADGRQEGSLFAGALDG